MTIFASVMTTFQMVFGKVVKDLNWPYFRISIASNTLMVLTYGTFIIARRIPMPEPSKRKWVAFRAVLSTCTFLSSIVAVQISGVPGDVTALTSINIVFAASLGHFFLSERLRLVHIAITFFSVVGAVLVAQPSFLFEVDKARPDAYWIGYLLALASGLFRACSLVCARKSAGVHVSIIALSTAAASVPFLCALPAAGLVDDGSLDAVFSEPATAAGLAFVLFASALIAITTSTAGAMMCPAAVSATVFTGSGMVFGYLAQTLLFSAAPSAITLAGAALMLAAVAAMAATRVPQQAAAAVVTAAAENIAEDGAKGDRSVASSSPSLAETEDETESLTSFAASEFAAQDPHLEAVRLRRPTAVNGAAKPAPQRVGVAATTAEVAATV